MADDAHGTHRSRSYGVGAPGGIHLVEYEVARAGSFGVHVDRERHQLTWLSGADLAVFTDGSFSLMTTDRAMWILAGTVHDIACTGPGRLVCAYVRADDLTVDAAAPVLVEARGIVSDLLVHLLDELSAEEGLRARGVLIDVLRRSTVAADLPPLPRDPRARAVAETVLRDPAGARLVPLADELGVDPRTIRRRFLRETGLTYRCWTTRARIAAALPLLDSAAPIAEVAQLVGYAGASGFIAAFRELRGETPGQHRARRRSARLLAAPG